MPCEGAGIFAPDNTCSGRFAVEPDIIFEAPKDRRIVLPEHEQLWAPWRLAYIKGNEKAQQPRNLALRPGADGDCFICRYVADDPQHDDENLVVLRTDQAIVILNRFPYNNGHLLIAPLDHQGRLDELTPAATLACQEQISRFVQVLEQGMNAEGFNIGLNLGRVAGAGLPGHLHWHIVPRWNGDTNFMPVMAGVDVIPQSLQALWELLRSHITSPADG